MIKPIKVKALPSPHIKKLSGLLPQARMLVDNDMLMQAIEIYRSILKVDPSCLEALHILGSLEFHFKNFQSALSLLRRAVNIQPKNFQLQLLTGKCAKQLRQFELAKMSFNLAQKIDPNSAETYVELGLLHFSMGNLSDAIESLQNALEIDSKYYDAWNNLGVIQKENGDFEKSLYSYGQAIEVDSYNPNAFANRGVLKHMLGLFDDALSDLNQAIQLAPNTASYHLSLGQLLLTLGEYEQGWQEFEQRWQYLSDNQVNVSRYKNFPLWTGRESLIGKRILLYAEQGLGDTLQFCRYINLVALLGGEVIFECEAPLVELFRNLDGPRHLIVQGAPGNQKEALPEFDFQCPLMSLPRVFRTTLDSIPNAVPYIFASPNKVRDWEIRLGAKHRPRVGLVWSGGLRPGQPELWSVNKRRNIALSTLATLRDVPVDFVSLQKGDFAEAELTELVNSNWDGPSLINHVAQLQDFSDTAALIANLDLVISVDTSTAHLSAALGKPTWILNRFDTCWRWLINREDSPWYPSVRLYRQSELNLWEPVVDQLRTDLLQFCAN